MSVHGDDNTIEEASGVLMNSAAAVSRAAEALVRRLQNQRDRQAAEVGQRTEELQRRYEAQAAGAERFYRDAARPEWASGAKADEVAVAWKGAHQWAAVDQVRFGGHADRMNETVRLLVGSDPRRALAVSGSSLGDSLPVLVDLVDQARDTAATERDRAGAEQGVANDERGREAHDLERERTAENPGEAHDAHLDAAEDHSRAVSAELAVDEHQDAAVAAEDLEYDTEGRRAATQAALLEAGAPEQAVAAKMTADHLNGQHPRTAAAAAGKKPAKARVNRGRGAGQQKKTRDAGLSR